MKAVVYTRGSLPGELGSEAAQALMREGHAVRYRNARFWQGETEPYDVVVTERKDIRAAYEEAGVEVRGFATAEPEDPSEVEPPKKASPEEEMPDEEPTAGNAHRIEATGGGWYEVIGPDGEPVNEKGLREEDAEALRDKLNSEEE